VASLIAPYKTKGLKKSLSRDSWEPTGTQTEISDEPRHLPSIAPLHGEYRLEITLVYAI
jgi:hypothetical protein